MFVHTYVLDFKSIPELNRTADDNFCLANLATLFRAVGTEESCKVHIFFGLLRIYEPKIQQTKIAVTKI